MKRTKTRRSMQQGARAPWITRFSVAPVRGGRGATTLLILLTSVSITLAQETGGALLGIGAGIDLGVQTTSFPVYAGLPDCGLFTTGSVVDYWGGGAAIFPRLFSPKLGLSLRAAWSGATGELTAAPVDPLVIYDEIESASVRVDHEYRFESETEMVRLDLLATYAMGDGWGLHIGPWAGYRYSSALSQIDRITGGIYRFDSSNEERPMEDGEKLTSSSIAAGAFFSIGRTFPITDRLAILPEIFGRAELTSASNEVGWRTFSGGVGLFLLFDVSRRSEPPPVAEIPIAPPVADTATRSAGLRASIDLYGVDELESRLPAATININEVLYRRRSSLLRPIYFEPGSAAISDRYVRYSRSHAGHLRIDSLGGLGMRQISSQTLNLLALRMRDDQGATLTLAGRASRDEVRTLARERAASVRSYLHDVWGITPSRITVKSASAARGEESRSVTISSGSSSLLKPVVVDHLARSYEPPLIALDPVFDAAAGLKSWIILLKHNGREVGKFSSGEDSGGERASLNWRLSESEGEAMSSFLAAELTVEDSAGRVVTANAQAPLKFERNRRVVECEELRGGAERITFSLFPFQEYSDRLAERNRGVIGEVVDSITVGARITIVGYTGFLGDRREDLALARRRADSVGLALRRAIDARGIAGVTITSDHAKAQLTRRPAGGAQGEWIFRQIDLIVDRKGVR